MRLRRGERGAAVVEFALVLPILMMFVFGILEFGRGYNARIELTSAVRQGARTAALFGTSCPILPATQNFTDCVTTSVRDGAPGLTRSAIQVTPTACPDASTGTNARVVATYPFRYDIPFVGRRQANLTATGVMQCGG
ncbi:MAG TPA: TadE family protein [Acidimicrobiales bacterium]|nr:TadE family protein [Acidimicrobiales bacterium]